MVNNFKVKVTVEVEVEADANTDQGAALRRLCRKRLEETGLIDLVKAVNWRLGFNLKTLVSSLLVIWINVPCLCEFFKGSSAPHSGDGNQDCVRGWIFKWSLQRHCPGVSGTVEEGRAL